MSSAGWRDDSQFGTRLSEYFSMQNELNRHQKNNNISEAIALCVNHHYRLIGLFLQNTSNSSPCTEIVSITQDNRSLCTQPLSGGTYFCLVYVKFVQTSPWPDGKSRTHRCIWERTDDKPNCFCRAQISDITNCEIFTPCNIAAVNQTNTMNKKACNDWPKSHFFCVHFHVHSVVAGIAEFLITLFAIVRSLTRMNPDMRVETAHVTKRFATNLRRTKTRLKRVKKNK